MIPNRYNITNISKAISNPRMLLGEINRMFVLWNGRIWSLNNEGGVNFIQQDWDTLILLDGCRYDTFEATADIYGDLKKIQSPASESREFMNAHFKEKQLHDTVYITANPHTETHVPDGTFHDVIRVYLDGWDEDLQTVPPSAVTDSALKAHSSFPNKRLIVHYMQPHFPFIGPTGQNIKQSGLPNDGFDMGNPNPEQDVRNVWRTIEYGLNDLSLDKVRQAYRENLKITLPEVKQLISEIDGKTIISSDHGNLIGDWLYPLPSRGFGHPRGVAAEALRTVPWMEFESGSRRQISSDPPRGSAEVDESMEERLKHLGYK